MINGKGPGFPEKSSPRICGERSPNTGGLWKVFSGCCAVARNDLLPEKYGRWNTIYKHFARWCDQHIWQAMHQHLVHVIVDGLGTPLRFRLTGGQGHDLTL
jgi:transposase